jgi:hypothetical protein
MSAACIASRQVFVVQILVYSKECQCDLARSTGARITSDTDSLSRKKNSDSDSEPSLKFRMQRIDATVNRAH